MLLRLSATKWLGNPRLRTTASSSAGRSICLSSAETLSPAIILAGFCNSHHGAGLHNRDVMEIYTLEVKSQRAERRIQHPVPAPVSRPALSQWTTPDKLGALSASLARGGLPSDLLSKLRLLAAGDLSHRFIEQNCRLFAALLSAAEQGSFREGSPTERERLLRVLAYVREDNDAIPDRQVNGFTDDQREVRAASVELAALLQAFKAWRLRFQVPAMWQAMA